MQNTLWQRKTDGCAVDWSPPWAGRLDPDAQLEAEGRVKK